MRAIISFILLLISYTIWGQPDQSNHSIADRYPGGADSLRKYIASNLRFPPSAVDAGRVGLSISSITITPEGNIDNAAIHNSLGDEIDRTVTELLYLTDGHWIPTKGYPCNQTFYFQMSFEFEASRNETHFTIKEDTVLDEVKVTVMGFTPPAFIALKSLNISLERSFEKEKYGKALDLIEELHRRDPLNIHYYELQAQCYAALGKVALQTDVERRIQECSNHNALFLLKEPVLYGNIKIIDTLENSIFSVKEITRDSLIIYSGKLVSVKPEIRQGKYYFFNSEGKIGTTGEYLENIPVGTWNYYDSVGQIIHSPDYSKVVKFIMEDENNPLIDSTFLGREDLYVNTNGSFAIAEVMPLFNGKDPAWEFRKHISEQLIYPVFAKLKRIEGRVIVQFTIDKEGKVREPVVVSGAHIDLNMEALRIIINSRGWTPGKIEGKNVNVVFTFPVNFSLGNEIDLSDLLH